MQRAPPGFAQHHGHVNEHGGMVRRTVAVILVTGGLLVTASCGCSPIQPPAPPTTTSADSGVSAQRCSIDLRTLKTAVEAYRVLEGAYPVTQDDLLDVVIDQRITTADFRSTRRGPPVYTQVPACR